MGDRGSASVLVLGVGLAVILLSGGMVFAADVVVAGHRAQIAADLGALAGAGHTAGGAGAACERAGLVVAENRARMVDCRLDGADMVVTAVCDSVVDRRAIARAGDTRPHSQRTRWD